MPIFNTATLDNKSMLGMDADRVSNIYNGLDCCVTLEIFESLFEELCDSPVNVRYTYEMAMAKQAPFLEMSMRGLRIDSAARDTSIREFSVVLDGLRARFDRLCKEIFGTTMNFDSPAQMKTLFYGLLGINEIKARNSKGQYAATVNEEALLKLCQNFWAQPFAQYILAMRDVRKKISFLKTGIDPDGRMRTSINIAGTNTGRLSSSKSDFGTGGNLQNIDTRLRYPFVADEGMIFVNVDLEQADARNVGAIIWDTFYEEHGPEEAGRYLDACESGDLHTQVTRMAWRDLPWPEDQKLWRAIANLDFTGGMTYRDAAKKLGHGTNYYGQPSTMAKHTKTPVSIIEEFQKRYFSAFPLIPEWHKYTISGVRFNGVLTTPFGRRRFFFDRGDASETWRAAIAYSPQSRTGHEIDMGILNAWRHLPDVQFLMQVHDSILFQVPWDGHEAYIEAALQLLRYEHTLKHGRIFSVPLEAKVGWNWGDVLYWDSADVEAGRCRPEAKGQPRANFLGLSKWKGKETREPPSTKRRLKDYLK